ncbi:serine aminopeptidase domain-containing protein [Mucilaginibacter sp.]
MRKFTFLILILFCAVTIFAQPEPLNYGVAVNKFKNFYNADKPDSVFDMFSGNLKIALPLNQFKTTTTQLKAQLGTLNKTEFVKYNEPLGIYRATFQNAVFLLNIALDKTNKLTGLRLTPEESKTSAALPADPSVTETPITLKTLATTISGTLAIPNNTSGKIPVVIIIPGAGPVDRDGNSANGLNTNMYKMLAYSLGKNGIASVRYDKRMLGQIAGSQKEKDLRFEDNVDDVVSLIDMLGSDERFSKIILVGHSDGSLVGMLAAHDEPIKGFISLEGYGVPGEKVLTEEFKDKPGFLSEGIKNVLDSLKRGKINYNVDPQLYATARPSIQSYIMSWCRYDPTNELHKLKIPILIVQGSNDLKVSIDNGQKLKNAKGSADYMLIRGMNYVLKDAPIDKEQNLATYKNPELPLSAEMVITVVDFIQKLK